MLPESASRRSLVVLLARVLLLLLAAGAVAVALVVTHARPAQVAAARTTYVCPMHPNVVAARPGDCPVCGMALVARDGASAHPSSLGAPLSFKLAPQGPPAQPYSTDWVRKALLTRGMVA